MKQPIIHAKRPCVKGSCVKGPCVKGPCVKGLHVKVKNWGRGGGGAAKAPP